MSSETVPPTLITVCYNTIRDAANGDIIQKSAELRKRVIDAKIPREVVAAHNAALKTIGFDRAAYDAANNEYKTLVKITKDQEAFDKYKLKNPEKGYKSLDAATKQRNKLESTVNAGREQKELFAKALADFEVARRKVWTDYKTSVATILRAAHPSAKEAGSAESVAAQEQLGLAEHADMAQFDTLRRNKSRVPKAGARVIAVYLKHIVDEMSAALRTSVEASDQSKTDVKHLFVPGVLATQFMRIASHFDSFKEVAAWDATPKAERGEFPLSSSDFTGIFKKLIPKKSKDSNDGSKVSQNLRIGLASMASDIVSFFCRSVVPPIMEFSGKKTIDSKALELAILTATAIFGGPGAAVVEEWNGTKPAKIEDAVVEDAPAAKKRTPPKKAAATPAPESAAPATKKTTKKAAAESAAPAAKKAPATKKKA
jgi:hypothetical protein